LSQAAKILDPISDAHTARPLLVGKKAVVTGGTLGIGRAIARLLSAEGMELFIFSRESQHVKDGLAAIREVDGKAEGMVADVSKAKDVERAFAAARENLGELDLLVVNAGIAGEGVADMENADWRYVVETNLVGAMATAREGLLWMAPRKQGHIVFIGSMSAEREGKDSSVYVAGKSGLRGFAESLHKEARDKGVKVTLIEPGQVGSDMQESSSKVQQKEIRAGKMLRAEDIAVAVHYVFTQPPRCDVTFLQIRPHNEGRSQ
jgi:NADP-dependent 3-hydroxy acid dehydrogenase YdfG